MSLDQQEPEPQPDSPPEDPAPAQDPEPDTPFTKPEIDRRHIETDDEPYIA
jgi:hypothetical protein